MFVLCLLVAMVTCISFPPFRSYYRPPTGSRGARLPSGVSRGGGSTGFRLGTGMVLQ